MELFRAMILKNHRIGKEINITLRSRAVQLTLMSAHVSVSERKPLALTVSMSAVPLTFMVSASGECSPLMSAHMSVSGSYFYSIHKFLKLRASSILINIQTILISRLPHLLIHTTLFYNITLNITFQNELKR